MSRKQHKTTSEYYSSKELRSVPASYYMNIGIRSNGKSFDSKSLVRDGLKEGKKFAYIRRLHKHIVRSKMETLFSDNNKYFFDRDNFAIGYSPSYKGFFMVDEYGEVMNEELGPVGKTYALEDMMIDKGETFLPDIIWFDEFVDDTYFSDEIHKFLHVMSTLIRNRKSGVTVIMSGNTINKNCPYFKLFGIPIDKIRQGDILTINHQNGVCVRFEYCKRFIPQEVVDNDGDDYYFGFDDTTDTVMITTGDWETMEINCKGIDGYTWASPRKPINMYISNRRLFEISIAYTTTPVAYVREVNNTNGIIRPNIKYILSFDGRRFIHKDGTYPCTIKPNGKSIPLLDPATEKLYNRFIDCVNCGRLIATDPMVGTEFINSLKQARIIA